MTCQRHTLDVEHELTQYIETALWSSTDESTPEGGEPMDANYSADDLAPEAVASMRADLEAFLSPPEHWEDFDHAGHVRALEFWQAELGAGQVGHDFWLTRNGHGAGFWDRFSSGVGASFGEYLTEQSRPFGESYVYVGDDGRVYVS